MFKISWHSVLFYIKWQSFLKLFCKKIVEIITTCPLALQAYILNHVDETVFHVLLFFLCLRLKTVISYIDIRLIFIDTLYRRTTDSCCLIEDLVF